MVEFKFDSKTDQNYSQNILETEDALEIYVDQIKMGLESDLGSIMGADVTLDLERLVFEQNLDADQIRGQIREIISNFCSFYPDFPTTIDVIFTKGEIRDICLISIRIDGGRSVNVVIS